MRETGDSRTNEVTLTRRRNAGPLFGRVGSWAGCSVRSRTAISADAGESGREADPRSGPGRHARANRSRIPDRRRRGRSRSRDGTSLRIVGRRGRIRSRGGTSLRLSAGAGGSGRATERHSRRRPARAEPVARRNVTPVVGATRARTGAAVRGEMVCAADDAVPGRPPDRWSGFRPRAPEDRNADPVPVRRGRQPARVARMLRRT